MAVEALMKALVVGLGRMGRLHHKVLLDLGYDVLTADPAVINADFPSASAALLADREGFRYANDPITIAVVAVPIPALVDTAFQLAGVPKLLVEKPFAPSVQEALMLGAYLKERGSDVAVGYVERFNPAVRDLRERLRHQSPPTAARFVRHNVRPSADPERDLLIHDVDLASYLRLWTPATTFDVKADNAEHVRRIEVDVRLLIEKSLDVEPETKTLVADLMDHGLSPLHAMWHSFLVGGDEVARPQDAVRALERARAVMTADAVPT